MPTDERIDRIFYETLASISDKDEARRVVEQKLREILDRPFVISGVAYGAYWRAMLCNFTPGTLDNHMYTVWFDGAKWVPVHQ